MFLWWFLSLCSQKDEHYYWLLLYTTIPRSWRLEQTHCAVVACDSEWVNECFEYPPKWCQNLQRYLVVTWLMPREATAVMVHILCPPYSHAPVYSGTSFEATFWWRMENHIWAQWACSRVENNVINNICSVRVCLAVTCHLHFWQNDRDISRATAITRGWNRYRNKIQHRKLTLDKNILPPLLQGFEPATFQLRFRRSNHWAFRAFFSILVVLVLPA